MPKIIAIHAVKSQGPGVITVDLSFSCNDKTDVTLLEHAFEYGNELFTVKASKIANGVTIRATYNNSLIKDARKIDQEDNNVVDFLLVKKEDMLTIPKADYQNLNSVRGKEFVLTVLN